MRLFIFLIICTLCAQLSSTGQSIYKQKDQWQQIIDSTWGAGPSTTDKLSIFDAFWDKVDQEFGCFPNLSVNWDSLRDAFRPQVAAGVSRGRFFSIMSQMCRALREFHTFVYDDTVEAILNDPTARFPNARLVRGVPLIVTSVWGGTRLGVGLSPLPDTSLLVYQSVEGHPLGLQPGDIILGYESEKWTHIIQNLKAGELPVSMKYAMNGTDPQSELYGWLVSAGNSWHLFDTIDIIKYSTGDTIHLDTEQLETAPISWDTLFGLGPTRINGIPEPDPSNNVWTTYGILPGTTIGYVRACMWDAGGGQQFNVAIDSLMYKTKTTGLILDFRHHLGGWMDYVNNGFAALFNIDPTTNMLMGHRTNPSDHMGLTLGPINELWFHKIPVTPDIYEHPIAVLTGPATVSGGEYASFLLRFHPMVRIFGKPTNTAYVDGQYDEGDDLGYGGSRWSYRISKGSAYSNYNGEDYIIHKGFNVDEEIWHNREDAANGIDAVVERAKEWIINTSHTHDIAINKLYYSPATDSVRLRGIVKNPNSHPLIVKAYYNRGETLIDSSLFFDNGLHNDSIAGDGVWGTEWIIPPGEYYYNVDVSTYDPIDTSHFLLQQVQRFVTVGPVAIDSITMTRTQPEWIKIQLWLRNHGLDSTIYSIRGVLKSTDPNVISFGACYDIYGTLLPGQRNTTTAYYNIKIDTSLKYADLQLTMDVSTRVEVYWTYNLVIPLRMTPVLSKNNLDFGALNLGESKKDSIVLRNPNNMMLEVLSASTDLPTQYSVSPTSAAIPPLDSQKFYVTFNPTTYGTYNGYLKFSYDGTGSPVFVNIMGKYSPPNVQFIINEGWNMVSLPMQPYHYEKDSIFPSSLSKAFTYNNGYNQVDTLSQGVGYWLKYSIDSILAVPGTMITIDTFDISPGWNMIGSITYPVLVNSITSDPGGMELSNFYRYAGDSQYEMTDTINPGYGYWIKASEVGKLILSSSVNVPMSGQIKIVSGLELPPPPPDEIATVFPEKPSRYALQQAYPNPFNPVTIIRYEIPKGSLVVLKVFDMLGQEIKTLINEYQEPGYKEVIFDASTLSSGIYFYRLQAGGYTNVKKMQLIK